MDLEKKTIDSVTLITIKEPSIEARNASEVKATLLNLMDNLDGKFILDLSHVSFIDSAGLSVFISIYKLFANKDHFTVCGVQPSVYPLFKYTSLIKILKIFTNSNEALHHFGAKVSV